MIITLQLLFVLLWFIFKLLFRIKMRDLKLQASQFNLALGGINEADFHEVKGMVVRSREERSMQEDLDGPGASPK